ncbi:hypothetical protein BG004_001373 [Podila humilis]|nr:hypothetical protein BG004_001373 [Podila humilis]
MLNLPEIIDNVCQFLDRSTLLQCTSVSKLWHTITQSHLWREIPELEYESYPSFRHIVLQDYYHQKQKQKQKYQKLLEYSPKDLSPASLPLSLSTTTLEKWGRFIRYVHSFNELIACFRYTDTYIPQLEASSSPPLPLPNPAASDAKVPDEYDLLCHFIQACPNARLRHTSLASHGMRTQRQVAIIQSKAIPISTSLSISLSRSKNNFPVTVETLQHLVQAGTTCLKKLSITVNNAASLALVTEEIDSISSISSISSSNSLPQSGDRPLDCSSIKELKLDMPDDSVNLDIFRNWLFGFCGASLSKLSLVRLGARATEKLTNRVYQDMPNIEELELGDPKFIHEDQLYDAYSRDIWHFGSQQVADLITQVPVLKLLRLNPTAGGGSHEVAIALIEHTSTLEDICVARRVGFPDFRYIVSVSPRLKKVGGAGADAPENSFRVGMKEFAQVEGESELLEPWICEDSLECLEMTINRHWEENWAKENDDPDKYQVKVFERLARLKNLKTLRLGHVASKRKQRAGEDINSWVRDRRDIRMKLGHGLELLKSLQQLEELQVFEVGLDIGLQEVQWMHEQWPRLRHVYGLRRLSEARTWLTAHGIGVE